MAGFVVIAQKLVLLSIMRRLVQSKIRNPSSGNRGVAVSNLQMLHVHVFLVAPLGACDMVQTSTELSGEDCVQLHSTCLHNLQEDNAGIFDNAETFVAEYRFDAWGRNLSLTGCMTETLRSLGNPHFTPG